MIFFQKRRKKSGRVIGFFFYRPCWRELTVMILNKRGDFFETATRAEEEEKEACKQASNRPNGLPSSFSLSTLSIEEYTDFGYF